MGRKGLGGGEPVAAAVQRVAGAVDADGAAVTLEADHQQHGRMRGAGLGAIFAVVVRVRELDVAAEARGDGEVDALGDRAGVVEARLVGGGAHGQADRGVRRKQVLPRDVDQPLRQHREADGRELGQAHEHARGCP
ncbi:hypothetical protein [Nannocystis pusilla]|uniref:hypothetical protein n=1 Tax=Nannocystis pusilla TaxID=889268 RepID=UPI003B75DF38